MLFLQLPDEIWQCRTGENLMIFDKDHDITEEGRLRIASSLRSFKFLQPSIGVRYDYYVQLVAIERGQMRVAVFEFDF